MAYVFDFGWASGDPESEGIWSSCDKQLEVCIWRTTDDAVAEIADMDLALVEYATDDMIDVFDRLRQRGAHIVVFNERNVRVAAASARDFVALRASLDAEEEE